MAFSESNITENEEKEVLEVKMNSTKVENGLILSCEIDDVLTYAAVHNGEDIVRDICIKNSLERDLEYLTVNIRTDNDLAEPFSFVIEKIKPEEELHFRNLKLKIHGSYLASLTERSLCRITVTVNKEEETLCSGTADITVLAFDQWPGLSYTPELLAAFAMPNHPAVTGLLQIASKYLEKWTGDPSLAGYQFRDPNRVRNMAGAVYAAIQQKNITYAEPPSSFEVCGQRIRLADAVLDQHLGTCMDLTLLYTACLEAMGLNPVLILMRGHIFAGVWLMDESFSDMIMDDPSQLEKRMSRGIHEIMVVECTAMCSGKSHSFDEAEKIAERNVSDYGNFAFVIDVKRARSMGIRPLPVRIKTAEGFAVEYEEREEKEVTSAPKRLDTPFDLTDSSKADIVTKVTQWERKLLDLSLRNMLINMRLTRAVVPLLSPDVSLLEDALSDGEEFQVLPRPADMSLAGDGGIPVEALKELGPFGDFIALESRHRRLHSLYTEKELNTALTKMYRSARTSLEENGASTLYLALGLLRWFEGKKSTTPRYAPVVLVPINIVRKSASKGYAMHMRDEDAQINITLLEFLKQNYDMQIFGLNPPPIDEHGLDLPKIFAILRHAVMNLPMWDVVEVGFIGNFSFSQFVMWNDIHSNHEFLEKNKIVHSLISGAVEWDCTIPESADTDEAYLPVTVDASQLRAINMAAEGVSFVLHGPPGTGKSQTITAMIANALTKGRTILFVAEKMAALEVVQRRLAALGIQDFCLELHSNKATKKAVLDQLKRGLERKEINLSTDYDKKIQDIRTMRRELDSYAKALHTKRTFGKSLRQLMDLYEMIPETGTFVLFDHEYAGTLTESDLDHQTHSLERLIAAGKSIGHPHDHPLLSVHQTEYSQRLKFELDNVIRTFMDALEELEKEAYAFSGAMEMKMPVSGKEWSVLHECAVCVAGMEKIPLFLRQEEQVESIFEMPLSYLEHLETFLAKKDRFLSEWNENFLQMNMDSFREKYDQANKKFFGKGKALSALTAEIQAYASFTVETGKIPAYLTDITFYQQEAREIEKAKESLPGEWKEVLTRYPEKNALQNYKETVKKQLSDRKPFSLQLQKLEREGKEEAGARKAERLLSAMERVEREENRAQELLKLHFEKDNWLESRQILCSCILRHASMIKDWIVYRQFDAECREQGLSPICDAYEAGVPHEELMYVYLRSIYQSIILSVIEKEPVLNSFTGVSFNEKIAQFKKLDQEFMELTREEMVCRLTRGLPSSDDFVEVSRELNILRRAISSNGRGVSVRSLFEQITHILTGLAPCMLMSPISVSQYLQAKNDLFDIVIFDEASQLPTCKAVGVLARGKNAVIVGDPNQMPPTSFFAGNTVDEENLDIEDLDSILDDCLALGMPQAYLHWHYRSRHESLIAFSNREFYENSMFTFPSANDREKKVRLIQTEGFFDRGKGRVNEGEAKAIVSEIRKRYEDSERKEQTIGVVTFNIAQQNLIEDLLQEEYKKDAEFDRWANNGEEQVFVKNLENVQGDERDVILFSIAFGPDAEGKLSLNFGPLNKNGGWKRLNVAVSRARTEMVVFTTMTADMIDLKRTKSKGVEALKDFLEFAQKGRLQGEYVEKRIQTDQGILERICKCISDAGFQYQKSVGHSRFKVDIAVVNPYNEAEYLLGILLDGESYRQSVNTRDREVAQVGILKGLGWEIYRIWTMDWWDNRDRELKKLVNLLNEKKETAREEYLKKLGEEAETTPEAEKGTALETEKETESEILAETELKPLEKPQESNTERWDLENAAFCNLPAAELSADSERLMDSVSEEIKEDSPETEEDLPQLSGESTEEIKGQEPIFYEVTDYVYAQAEAETLSSTDYIKKEYQALISEKMQEILNTEAPISYDRLVRKTLRAFHIARSSPQTLEATDRAFKKVSARLNKQNGMKFYWRKDQEPDRYGIYRMDTDPSDKRSADEICQQELKNAVCVTLQRKGALEKDSLIKETIRTMGYSRSGPALITAVERGLKYGRKTGEILVTEDRQFVLNRESEN